jgi:hypothetical protein
MELSAKQNGMISDYRGMVKEVMSKYDGLMEKYSDYKGMVKEVMSRERKLIDEYHDLTGLFDKSVSMTKTAFGRIEDLERDMRGGLLIKPGRRTAEKLQRRAKILLQVAPDWQKRTAPVNARLTPEEERKVMELINESKS